MASAQTYISTLIPRPELLRPRLQPGTLAQDAAADMGLHIEILKGDRGINVIKKKTAVTPVVEVHDRNRLPVAGVAVTFTAPSDGPSVVFMNGSRSITVMTDANGQASARVTKPVNEGSFQITVSATFQTLVTTATISMTNYLKPPTGTTVTASEGESAPAVTAAPEPPAEAPAGTAAPAPASTGAKAAGMSGKMIGILVGVGAAAAVGIAVGLSSHGSSSTAATTTTATIGVGSGGTVGAPH